MKLITAVIRTDDLPVVMNAATDAGARGLTASRASGFGQQYGHVRQAAQGGQLGRAANFRPTVPPGGCGGQ